MSVVVDADHAADALCDVWEHLVGVVAGAWSERRRGAIAVVTGAEVPTLNGVWAHGASPDLDAVDSLLDEVAGAGVPFCLQHRPDAPAQLEARASRRGLVRSETVPLMVLDEPGAVADVGVPAGLVLRQLAPDEAELHVITAAAGFGAPETVFRPIVTPTSLSAPGVRCYLGEADGHPVTTGIGVTLGDAVGVFNIATPVEHRGRGYGAALTARVVADGMAHGGRYAFLQSSPDGFSVYRRLGFRVLEDWPCWLSIDTSGHDGPAAPDPS